MKFFSRLVRKIPCIRKLYALYDQVQNMESRLHELREVMNECTFSEDPRRTVTEYDYYLRTGRFLDLEHPRTFNEKLQWLKLYDNSPLKSQFSDKYHVRAWIAKEFGNEYLVPLLGVWDRFDEIDFSLLPNQFVIKTNCGSGDGIIVRDKSRLDLTAAKSHFDKWLLYDYAKQGMELSYHGISPKLLVEKLLEDDGTPVCDYKFICIHGKAVYCWIDIDRFTDHRRNIYNMQWEQQPFTIKYPSSKRSFDKPENFEEMRIMAERCAAPFIHARVDFYNIRGEIYFQEMTFCTGTGCEKFTPAEYDEKLGDLICLPGKE